MERKSFWLKSWFFKPNSWNMSSSVSWCHASFGIMARFWNSECPFIFSFLMRDFPLFGFSVSFLCRAWLNNFLQLYTQIVLSVACIVLFMQLRSFYKSISTRINRHFKYKFISAHINAKLVLFVYFFSIPATKMHISCWTLKCCWEEQKFILLEL